MGASRYDLKKIFGIRSRRIGKCVVSTSGGVSSAVALIRAVRRFGASNVESVFMDTSSEDSDLYRFIDDVDALLGIKTTVLKDGRNIWEVARDHRFIPNSRIDVCSRVLKREPFYKYIDNKYARESITLAYGFTAAEITRVKRLEKRCDEEGRKTWFPLLDDPEVFSDDAQRIISAAGIRIPRLYTQGFEHNNCGGFCFKAGQRHFAHLLSVDRQSYLYHESKEREMQVLLGKAVTVLRRVRDGVRRNVSLEELRYEIEHGQGFDTRDSGTPCDCFGVDSCDEGVAHS